MEALEKAKAVDKINELTNNPASEEILKEISRLSGLILEEL